MPRPGPQEEPRSRVRVERALYHRCRRGEPEALAALLYSLVDRLHTAAAYVLPDESAPLTVVATVWHEVLDLLQGPYVGGHLPAKAFARLQAQLELQADPAAVARAVARAQEESDEGLIPYPAADLRVLVDAIPLHAAEIARRTVRRRLRRRQVALALAAFVVVVMGYNVWLRERSHAAASDVQIQCLQERVVRGELALAIHDCLSELPDPQGADRYEARLLREVGLVLEELSNLQGAAGRQVLGYLAQRVQQGHLSAELGQLLAQRDGLPREQLAQTQLILEEVENL